MSALRGVAGHTALLGLFLCGVFPALANDWPQWQGPDRTNQSKETGLLREWPKDGPKKLWTFKDLGKGFGGPSIVGDRLYVQGTEGSNESLFCIDVKEGKKVWATAYSNESRASSGDGPRANPTVDGDLIFGIGSQGQLFCIDTKGEKKWSKSLKSDLSGSMMSGWGYSESPLVDGDKVVCTPGGRQGAIAAFNKSSGELLWRSKEFTDSAAYSSIVIATIGGVKQYVQMTGSSVAGIAAEDGKLLWRQPRQARTAACATPLVKDNFVFVTSAYGAECLLTEVIADGKTFKTKAVYQHKDHQNHHGGVVLLGDYIYGHSGGNGRPHYWACMNFKTGEIAWKSEKLGKGSCTYADGLLYCYSEGDGTVVLVDPNPKEWTEKGRFKNPDAHSRGNVWTHPVVANGRLYLRDQSNLTCFDVKAP
jgi:outer membrane protein assembly factor BamB